MPVLQKSIKKVLEDLKAHITEYSTEFSQNKRILKKKLIGTKQEINRIAGAITNYKNVTTRNNKKN